jgi:hypothetical protein
MRKTTIFRSSRLAAAIAFTLAATATAARAQDTLQVVQGAAQVAQPTVHVVQVGETLWGLAQQYLGDPFLWPEIYRINTTVVEDPHWIFPGEELRLVPADQTAMVERPVEAEPVAAVPEAMPQPQPAEPAQPAEAQPVEAEPEVEAPDVMAPPAPPPPPPSETAPTIFARSEGRYGGLTGGRSGALRYRPVRRGEFYSSGFLTEDQDLPWGHVLGAVGRPTLRNLTASSSQMRFGDIEIRPPRGATYQVGDSLLLARLSRDVGSGWGMVVVPTGIGVVREMAEDRVIAEVVQQFDRVSDGQYSLPLEPFVDPGQVLPVPVSDGLTGEVVDRRNHDPVAGQQDILFISRGRNDGVTLGDVFAVLRPSEAGGVAPTTVALVQIVHVRDRSATGLLIVINDLGIEAGAPVQLARKMPT